MSVSKQLEVLFISTDRKIFDEGSEVFARMRDYASITEKLSIIVFCKKSAHVKSVQIAPNAWAYPTNSLSRWLYVFDAIGMAKRMFTLSSEDRLLTSAAEGKISLSLVSSQDPFECGLAGYFIAKALSIPLHLQLHTDFLDEHFLKGSRLNVLRKIIAQFLFRKHADIRAVSERIKLSIFEKMSFYNNAYPRVVVYPVFVDCAHFKNAEDTVHLSKKYPGYDLLILVVARLEKEKNVDLAIRLISAAAKRNPEPLIGLVIVGDGSEKSNLKKLAESLVIADRVFFEGEVADSAPYYKSADVLLVTSLYEGYGRMFAEAAAAGCLVVTRDVGAAREIITSSSGVVCGENDEECLLHNILLLANSHPIRDQLKHSALLASQRREPPSKQEYLAGYREILEKASLNDEFLPFA